MDRFKSTKIASILGITGNIFLLIIKGIVGFLTQSQAMIADAFNSAGDIFSSLMTFIGNRISSKGRDEDHNLGHGKAEYIYSLLISITMILLSITVIKNAIKTLINKETLIYSNWLIVVCIVTILVKFSLFMYTNRIYKKHNNILVKANSIDHRNDCVITTTTLISILLSEKGLYYVDGIVGILISLWILKTGVELFIDSYNVLMDKSMSQEIKDKVLKIIEKHKEVEKINHFNSTPVGYQYQISFTIFVDGNMTTFESHDIANSLEREIEKEIPEIFQTVIHVNPLEKKK